MNILITGGAGYIGSFVLRAFLEQKKHDICVVDNLSSGSLKTLEILKNLGDFSFFKCDLSDENELEKIFKLKQFEAILHFAAFIEVAQSMIEPLKYYTNNTTNTSHIVRGIHNGLQICERILDFPTLVEFGATDQLIWKIGVDHGLFKRT